MARSIRIRHLWLFDFAADFLAVVSAYYTTYLLRCHSEWGQRFFAWVNQTLGIRDTGEIGESLERFYATSALRIIVLLTLTLCLFYALRDLYSGSRFITRRPLLWDIVVANVWALALFFAYFYLRRNIYHPRSFFATLIVLNILYCRMFRALKVHALQFLRKRYGIDRHPTVLMGRTPEGRLIARLIEENHPHGIEIKAQVESDAENFERTLEAVRAAVRAQDADMIICADKDLAVANIMRLLEVADELDVSVKVLSNRLGVVVDRAKIPADWIRGAPLIHFERPSSSARYAVLRKVVSMLLAWFLLVMALPLMLVIALLIRLTSRGPVFFVQERIGVNRQPFRIFKFRTMYDRAEELQAEIEEINESAEGLFKIRNDPRVTPVGRLLRRFSLDELPQLINVIRGEMTLVGPRPLPRRDFENYYEDWHYSRHAGLPGLTCLWQVSGRSDIDFHNMCILDVFYLKNQSWLLDLKIILRTVWVVVFGWGAY